MEIKKKFLTNKINEIWIELSHIKNIKKTINKQEYLINDNISIKDKIKNKFELIKIKILKNYGADNNAFVQFDVFGLLQ